MQISKLVVLGLMLGEGTSAQVELNTLDTALWKVDTLLETLVVTPKFDFTSDTTVYFYEKIKDKKIEVLTLNYKNITKYIIGSFKGNTHYGPNNYIALNFYSRQLDSTTFIDLVDTIINSERGKDYCIKLENLGITNPKLIEVFQECCSNHHKGYIRIAYQLKEEIFPTACLQEATIFSENMPPYSKYEGIRFIEIRK